MPYYSNISTFSLHNHSCEAVSYILFTFAQEHKEEEDEAIFRNCMLTTLKRLFLNFLAHIFISEGTGINAEHSFAPIILFQQSNGNDYDNDYSTISSRVSITDIHVLKGLVYAMELDITFLVK